MTAYYNEIDLAAVAVLRQLIADGVIAPGDVDTRSIKEVSPDDLRGYTQCHFFAGGGLWSVAARMAGWPDDRPLWTGSCPCQPFSAAGKGLGTDDPRHLWPDFFRLIRACRPSHVMGEQVAGAAGYGWFDGVRADLASENYASRGVDIPACSVDAPHQRNRLYWIAVGNAASIGRGEGRTEHELRGWWPTPAGADASGVTLGDAFGSGLERFARHGDQQGRTEQDRPVAPADGPVSAVDVADDLGSQRGGGRPGGARGPATAGKGADRAHSRPESPHAHGGRNGSNWADAEWIVCHDGKARRAKPGLRDVAHGIFRGLDQERGQSDGGTEASPLNYRLLVDGMPGRVGLWKVAGNAIVPVLAAEVIGAFMEAENG